MSSLRHLGQIPCCLDSLFWRNRRASILFLLKEHLSLTLSTPSQPPLAPPSRLASFTPSPFQSAHSRASRSPRTPRCFGSHVNHDGPFVVMSSWLTETIGRVRQQGPAPPLGVSCIETPPVQFAVGRCRCNEPHNDSCDLLQVATWFRTKWRSTQAPAQTHSGASKKSPIT